MSGSQDLSKTSQSISGLACGATQFGLSTHHGSNDWLNCSEGSIDVLVLKIRQGVKVACEQHEKKSRKYKCNAGNDTTNPSGGQAPKEHTELCRFGSREDLIDGEDALEASNRYPVVLDDEPFLDQCDLGNWSAPCEETEIVKEEPEESEIW